MHGAAPHPQFRWFTIAAAAPHYSIAAAALSPHCSSLADLLLLHLRCSLSTLLSLAASVSIVAGFLMGFSLNSLGDDFHLGLCGWIGLFEI